MTDNPLGEFALISKYIASLADHPSAGDLKDDVANIAFNTEQSYIISQDAMVEGRHFLPWFDPFDIGYKLMTSNISDIIAKAGTPQYYLLSLMLPEYFRNDAWLKGFFAAIGHCQQKFGGHIIGGDTTAAEKLHLSLTVIGTRPISVNPHRSHAQEGDEIWLTGEIGDGELALNFLEMFEHNPQLPKDLEYLKTKLMRPALPFGIQDLIAAHAHASCDLSDGLLSDVAHIASASGLTAVIDFANIPRSAAFLNLCDDDFVGGGDDYQSLWSAPISAHQDILMHAKALNITVSCIGYMEKQMTNPVKLLKNDKDITPKRLGFTHF